MSRTLYKFGVPFDKATPSVHFPKRLKRPRNTAGPASYIIVVIIIIIIIIIIWKKQLHNQPAFNNFFSTFQPWD